MRTINADEAERRQTGDIIRIMCERVAAPADQLTLGEAALSLGCSTTMVRRHIASGLLPTPPQAEHSNLTRSDVETLALRIYHWRMHLNDLAPYWITGKRAADVLGVNVSRLNVLAGKSAIPFETHDDGTRLYRREQLEIVAQGRDAVAGEPIH